MMMQIVRKSQIFLGACVGFLIGIGCGELVVALRMWKYFFITLMIVLIVLTMVWSSQRLLVFVFVVVISWTGGVVRFAFDNVQRATVRDAFAVIGVERQELMTRAEIISEPVEKSGHWQYVVNDIEVASHDRVWVKFSGKMILTVPRLESFLFRYGDHVEGRVMLRLPRNTDSFPTYTTYLELSHIFLLGDTTQLVRIDENHSWDVYVLIFTIKKSIEEHIERVLPEPHASFLAAMLLGSRSSIPQELRESFRRTGLTHIIAVSGFNITIVGHTVEVLLQRFVRRTRAFWIVAGSIIVFVIMTGAQASVVRAGVMSLLSLIAIQIGRRGNVLNALLFAACIMVALNPLVLLHDIGFQLSFAATVGVVWVSPMVALMYERLHVPEFFQIRETLTLSSAAQLTTLPISLFHFGGISLIAPLANILVLPLIPFIMFVGSGVVLVSYIILPVAQVIAFIPWIVMEYEMRVISWCAYVPAAFFDTTSISVMTVVLWYVVLGVLLFIQWYVGIVGANSKRSHA